ncbi:MAG: N-acetyltransferase [Hyphomicrobiales bacterium]|nr:N-acetyltransferase [Hyphomicrobiales bacterium]
MTAPTIRPAAAADIPAITDIYAEAVRCGTATFEIDPPGEAEMLRRLSGLQEGGHPYLVATFDGSVAGYAYAGPYRARVAYRYTVEDSVYIAPADRGRGVGRALLASLITESEDRGFRQMLAVIGDSDHVASIRLHEAVGFSLVGTFTAVGYKFGRWLDTVLMQRALGAGGGRKPPP